MMCPASKAKGFSLLELLLTVGIVAMLLIAIFNLLQSFAEKELARSTNKYMSTVASAMGQILSNIDNFNALYNAARATGGGYQLIADSTAPATDNITKNFVVGGTTIQASRLLNSQFRATSPIRAQVRILLRISDNPATETDTRAMEVLIVTATPRPDGVVVIAANSAGPAGGWIRTYGNKAAAVMQHSFNSWRVTPSVGLQATPWYASELQASLNSNTQGSYLVHYMYVNLEDKTGDYLYRHEDVDTAGRLNTMYGPLSLGGNDIIGADDVNIGNAGSGAPFAVGDPDVPDECESGVMCVNGTGVVKGSSTISGNMVANGSALVADSMNAQSVRIQNGLSAPEKTAYGAQGLFVVDGTNGTQDTVNVTGNARFNDGVTSDSGVMQTINATVATVPDLGTFTTGNITNTRRITSTTTTARNLQVDHQLKAGMVSNGSVNVTGETAVIDITNSDNFVYGSGADPKTLTAPKINVNTMSISNFGACDTGCGQ